MQGISQQMTTASMADSVLAFGWERLQQRLRDGGDCSIAWGGRGLSPLVRGIPIVGRLIGYAMRVHDSLGSMHIQQGNSQPDLLLIRNL